jgi:hypothetical protein
MWLISMLLLATTSLDACMLLSHAVHFDLNTTQLHIGCVSLTLLSTTGFFPCHLLFATHLLTSNLLQALPLAFICSQSILESAKAIRKKKTEIDITNSGPIRKCDYVFDLVTPTVGQNV